MIFINARALIHVANLSYHVLRVVATGIISIGVIGCGRSLESTVSGTLTYRGNTVDGAQLVFQSKGNGPVGYAITNAQGEYELSTGGNQGVLPRTYRVAVSSTEVELPSHYGSVVTSSLEFDVNSGDNQIDIALE